MCIVHHHLVLPLHGRLAVVDLQFAVTKAVKQAKSIHLLMLSTRWCCCLLLTVTKAPRQATSFDIVVSPFSVFPSFPSFIPLIMADYFNYSIHISFNFSWLNTSLFSSLPMDYTPVFCVCPHFIASYLHFLHFCHTFNERNMMYVCRPVRHLC